MSEKIQLDKESLLPLSIYTTILSAMQTIFQIKMYVARTDVVVHVLENIFLESRRINGKLQFSILSKWIE